MIWVNNKFYPIEASRLFYNSVLVSPRTGQAWARIDRGCGSWIPFRAPADFDQPWPLPDDIPGSLLNWESEGGYCELPRPLLIREISLLERWTILAAACYNSSTSPLPENLSMNPALMQEIAALRAKIAADTISDDELRKALRLMREGRVTAAVTSAKAKAKSVPVDPDAALAAFLG